MGALASFGPGSLFENRGSPEPGTGASLLLNPVPFLLLQKCLLSTYLGSNKEPALLASPGIGEGAVLGRDVETGTRHASGVGTVGKGRPKEGAPHRDSTGW